MPLKSEQEVNQIRDALYILGEPSTVAEIALLASLPVDVVSKRLKNSGPQCLRPEWRKFRHDPISGRWSLTTGAMQEAERDAKG